MPKSSNRNKSGDARQVIFTVSEDEFLRSQRLYNQKGLRGALLAKVFVDLNDMIEEHGEVFAAALAYSNEDSATVLPRVRRAVTITQTLLEGNHNDAG